MNTERKTSGWNYRVVAEWTQHDDPVLSGWHFTIRDVYYQEDDTGSVRITMWGSDPQFPSAECYDELKADHDVMAFAFDKPILVMHEDELVETTEYMGRTGRRVPITLDDSLALYADTAHHTQSAT